MAVFERHYYWRDPFFTSMIMGGRVGLAGFSQSMDKNIAMCFTFVVSDEPKNTSNFFKQMIPTGAPTEVESSGCAFLDLRVKTRRFQQHVPPTKLLVMNFI